MISIIVCSANKELFRQFEDGTKKGITLPYEIIGIDQSGINSLKSRRQQ